MSTKASIWALVGVLLVAGGISVAWVMERAASQDEGRYFVATTGSDETGDGTRKRPWATLAYAASQVPADEGATLVLAAGTYVEQAAVQLPTGVSIEGAGPEETIITAEGPLPSTDGVSTPEHQDWHLMYHGSLIQLFSPGYEGGNNRYGEPHLMIPSTDGNQTLSGFTLDGNNKQVKAGVWVENRNGVTMHDVAIRNFAQRGAVFARSDMHWYIPLEDDYWMHNTKVHDVTFENNGAGLNFGNLNIGGLDGAEFYNLAIQDDNGTGIKFMFVGHFRNVRIHDAQIEVDEFDEEWGEKIAIELWNLDHGNEVFNVTANAWFSFVNHGEVDAVYRPEEDSTENLRVHNVRIVDRDGVSGKETIEVGLSGVEIADSYFQDKGFGIAVWHGMGDYAIRNIVIQRNIFANVHRELVAGFGRNAGVFIPDEIHNVKIYNNVFDGMGMGLFLGKAKQIDVRNNVFLNTDRADIAEGQGVRVDYNLKYHNDPERRALLVEGDDTFVGEHNVEADPGFVQNGARETDYYRPASANSPVVGAGSPVEGMESPVPIGRWSWESSDAAAVDVEGTAGAE